MSVGSAVVGQWERARVGETKLHISRVGLGGAPLGNLYNAVSEEQALATVERALQLGFKHIDTAPFYGLGMSEGRVGRALQGHRREEYTLSTKVGRVLVPSEEKEINPSYWVEAPKMKAVFDFSAEGTRKSLERSRKRLKMDKFDVLLLHDCDDYVEDALRYSYPVLSKLRERGEVDAIGAGLNSYSTALRLARREPFDCFLLAGRYTLLEQGAMDEFLPFCHDNKIGVIMGGVFNSGILASDPSEGAKYNYADASPEVLEKTRRIKQVCDAYGIQLLAAALQFVLANPNVTSVIPGCRSPEEVEGNSAALRQRIPSGLWDELKSKRLLREDAPT